MRILRQPRYAALSALMAVVALACIGAGTWQIVRFEQKVHANDALTAAAHKPAVPVAQVLPLVGAPAPAADAVRFRTVIATGRYDPAHQGLVRLRSVNGVQGYYVLTPLRTTRATLLVVRGFVAQRGDGSPRPGSPLRRPARSPSGAGYSRPRPAPTWSAAYRPASCARSTPRTRPPGSARPCTTGRWSCCPGRPGRPA